MSCCHYQPTGDGVDTAFTVDAPSWNRYNGQMSIVPPARSIRVGAEATIGTGEL